jgi:DNA-binding CsgD family transcriptional regulator
LAAEAGRPAQNPLHRDESLEREQGKDLAELAHLQRGVAACRRVEPNRPSQRLMDISPRNVMAGLQRTSGIPLIDDVPWGSHLCVFYETADDLLYAASCYFEPGLHANELCVWRLPRGVDVSETEARLRASIDDFDQHYAAGHLQLVPVSADAPFILADVERFWLGKLDQAIASGFGGLRACGDGSAPETSRQTSEYERALPDLLHDQPVLALCTYALSSASAMDVFDVVRSHNLTVARRNGEWQFMETPELQRANAFIRNLDDALAILSKPFPGHELLTERERMVLAYLVKGASSKEAGRELGISPRTVDFHRANIIEKLGARNMADAISRVLSR